MKMLRGERSDKGWKGMLQTHTSRATRLVCWNKNLRKFKRRSKREIRTALAGTIISPSFSGSTREDCQKETRGSKGKYFHSLRASASFYWEVIFTRGLKGEEGTSKGEKKKAEGKRWKDLWKRKDRKEGLSLMTRSSSAQERKKESKKPSKTRREEMGCRERKIGDTVVKCKASILATGGSRKEKRKSRRV